MLLLDSFSFHNENGRRELGVTLSNGHAWRIGAEQDGTDGHPLRSADGTDRTATRRERQILQAACNAFASYLTNEPAPASLSWGELAALEGLAELIPAGRAIQEEEERAEFLIMLDDCAANYWPM